MCNVSKAINCHETEIISMLEFKFNWKCFKLCCFVNQKNKDQTKQLSKTL